MRIDDADLTPDALVETVNGILGPGGNAAAMRAALDDSGAGNAAGEIARRIIGERKP